MLHFKPVVFRMRFLSGVLNKLYQLQYGNKYNKDFEPLATVFYLLNYLFISIVRARYKLQYEHSLIARVDNHKVADLYKIRWQTYKISTLTA